MQRGGKEWTGRDRIMDGGRLDNGQRGEALKCSYRKK